MSENKKPYYITTTLPYVNSRPHIGFALEIVRADVLARTERLEGRDVFFTTGTDEHGQKIWQKAQEEGQDVQAYVDTFAKEFKNLKPLLNLSYDNFIRTTDEHHIAAAQEMWRRCEENGDIYKKTYKGLYCVGCELFLTEKDLENNRCPSHPDKDLIELEEENYFFRFSKYQKELEAILEGGLVEPDSKTNEALAFVRRGLEDFSISRVKERMPWGIPVPGDEDHVMYVWFDALTNYISTLGWPESEDLFRKFWVEGETVQAAGKDNLRQQSTMWQAMLLSAGIPTTSRIYINGFIISGGQKMSKSIGNVINPFDVVDTYGTDFIRYFLLRHVHPFEDTDVTEERMAEAYNAHLVNGLGNLTSRILTMVENYGVEYVLNDKEKTWNDPEFEEYKDMIRSYEFQSALNWLWEGVDGLDQFIASEEPFKKIKTDEDQARQDVAYAALRLYDIAVLLEPVMPETGSRLIGLITDAKKPSEPLFERK